MMEATCLPPTCGEATEIPGVPSVGCVALLQHAPHSPAGFAACLFAAREEIYILGPDLRRRNGALASIRLWRPHSQQIQSQSQQQELKNIRITSLVAFFLLHQQEQQQQQPQQKQQESPLTNKLSSSPQEEGGIASDEVCAIVAWENDSGERQHITSLFFPLVSVLSGIDHVPGIVKETSFVQARNQQRLFRLFYHPFFTNISSRENGIHVVLCSCYDETVRKEACVSHSEENNKHVLTPGDSRGVLLGNFSFVVCSTALGDSSRKEVSWLAKPPDCVANWLLPDKSEGLICSIAVQRENSRVIAAFGTTNGRVILIYADGERITYRFGGPISDIAFVHTQLSHTDERYRYQVVSELLQKHTGKTPTSLGSNSVIENAEDAFVSLVFLDSLGRVIVLRGVNVGTPTIQVVLDIQQFVTLAGLRSLNSGNNNNNNNNNNTTEEPADSRLVPISSKNFFDLSSLRLPFQWRKQKETRSELRETVGGHNNITCETTDIINRRPLREDATLAGHILSRGLLCLTWTTGLRGRVELVVSTMSQSIVSIPFDKNEGIFSIAGVIVAPEPMFFVGFVDFFNTGVKEVVMAGINHVLVAKGSRVQQKERAALLLRLIKNKDRRSVVSEKEIMET